MCGDWEGNIWNKKTRMKGSVKMKERKLRGESGKMYKARQNSTSSAVSGEQYCNMYGIFSRTKNSVCNNEILRRKVSCTCPYKMQRT